MNDDWLFWRLFTALILGILFTGVLYWKRPNQTFFLTGREKPRYIPYFLYWLLPMYFLLILCFLPQMLPQGGGNSLLGILFQTFLQLALYDSLLLLLLPLLRRFLQPQTCVVLWLLPNYLYLVLSGENYQLSRPLVVIPISRQILLPICLLWLTGFIGILGWKILSHLRFRRRILKDAKTVTDPLTARLWEELKQWAGQPKKRWPLLVSPAVSTPLSIGLFSSTIRVVLPERNYTQEELTLILRHELIHIGRGDSSAKFFLTFCTALCWFNPLMWAAMRQGAEDLELSCDQEVLDWTDETGRQEYARLLLRTAGEQAGFTTCLSASASSLRRRLRRALHPGQRHICGLLVGLTAFALFLTVGWATLSYDVTGREVFFPGGAREDWTLADFYEPGTVTDPEALLDYLAGLELQCLAGQYALPQQKQARELTLFLDGPEGTRYVSLHGDVVRSAPINAPSYEGRNSYLVTDGVDWDYLDTLLPLA